MENQEFGNINGNSDASRKSDKVANVMMAISKYLPNERLVIISDMLKNCDENKLDMIVTVPKKDPVIALVLSLFLGCFGVDRFYVGNIGLGVGKLLTLGGCGIWAIIDYFCIMKAAREKNYEEMMKFLSM